MKPPPVTRPSLRPGLFALAGWLLATAPVRAAGPPSPSLPPSSTPVPMTTPVPDTPAETIFDLGRREASRFLTERVRAFDGFFGDQKLDDVGEVPWLRVRLGVEWEEGWNFKFRQRFRAYVPLPILERQLGAFIGTDEDELAEDPDYFDREPGNPAAAGLRYFFRKHEHLDGQISTGIRIRSSRPVVYLRPMLKGKVTRGRIYFEPRQSFFWYSDDGFGEETVLEFNYSLSRHFLFRLRPAFTWSETSRGIDLSQRISLRYLDRLVDGHPNFALNLEWDSSGYTHPSYKYDRHRLGLVARHRIWRPWLRLEYGPRLTWERRVPGDGDDFPEHWKNHVPSFLLYLEILFEDLRSDRRDRARS